MLTNTIDYGVEGLYFPFNRDAIIANPYINYIDDGDFDYISQIIMNCINETWWAWPWADDWRTNFYNGAGDKPAGGVPRVDGDRR